MTHRIHHFGAFRLDPLKHKLWRGNDRVSLPPKAFAFIAYLIEHRDRAVGRDELIAAVWNRVDISDNAVSQVVLHARRAVDDLHDQRVIRTVPRFGYHWDIPTESADETDPVTPPSEPVDRNDFAVGFEIAARQEEAAPPIHATTQDTDLPPAGSELRIAKTNAWPRRGLLFYVTATLIALIALARYLSTSELDRTPATPANSATATAAEVALVMPVQVSGGAESAWIRLGVMDAIADRLRSNGQPVLSSDSTVALLRDVDTHALDETGITRLASAASAPLIVAPRAEQREERWQVSLTTIHGRVPPLTTSAQASDVLIAAQAATDTLSRALGFEPVPAQSTDGERRLATLLKQARAAMLEGRAVEARDLLKGVDGEQRADPKLRYALADIDIKTGQLDDARTGLETLLRDASAADDPMLRARALARLAYTHYLRQDVQLGERLVDEAISLLEKHHAPQDLGRAYVIRGLARFELGRIDDALGDVTRARIIFSGTGEGLSDASVVHGIMTNALGRHAEAVPLLQYAATQALNFRVVDMEITARVALADAYLTLLDPAAALIEEIRLSELTAQTADATLRQFANLTRTEILFKGGRITDSGELLYQVRSELLAHSDQPVAPAVQFQLHRHEATLASRSAEPARAEAAAEAALRLAADASNGLNGATVGRDLAQLRLLRFRAQLAQGNITAANANTAELAAWAKNQRLPAAHINAALAEAEVAAAGNRRDVARASFERAMNLADGTQALLDVLEVARAYADFLFQERDLDRAIVVVGRVADFAARDFDAAILQLRLYHALAQPKPWRSALASARALAGERSIPPDLQIEP